jgi:hypothetical protein
MAAPQITALPDAPSRADDSATFTTKADAFVAALPTFGNEANTVATFCETQAETAEEAASVVSGLSQYQGLWDSGENYVLGDTVKYDGQFWIANQANNNSTPTEGADWAKANFFNATEVISGNTNAIRWTSYVATASLTLTLPSDPAVGDWVGFSNASETETCVIARNGKNIMALGEDMTVDIEWGAFTLTFSGDTKGWVFK